MTAVLPRHHAVFAEQYRAHGYWITGAVPDSVADATTADPQRTALVDAGGTLSYAELLQSVRRAAAGLHSLGVRRGDVVAIQLPNRREFAIFQQAVARLGAIYQPLLPQLRALDLEYLLGASKAVAIVIPDIYRNFDHRSMLYGLRSKLPVLKHVFVVGHAQEGHLGVGEFLSRKWENEIAPEAVSPGIDPDLPRAISFTSGTEARPKGILHSYNSLTYALRLHRDLFHLTPADAIFTPSPVGHSTGSGFGVEFAFLVGCKVVLMDGWNPEAAIEIIARERCTLMWGATTFFSDLVNAGNIAGHDVSCMRLASCAGAPIPRELVMRVRECFGGHLVSAYGQSEGTNVSITHLDDPIEKIVGSDGCFNPGIAWKLVDDDRRTLPPGMVGEIAYRGPNVCLGYIDPQHMARAFDDEGYLYSGDLGTVDADGYLRIVGRKKEIIIRGGENISPAEIEDALFPHPAIQKVAVVGVPDARLGQRACAVVIPKPGQRLTLADITEFLQARGMTRFKFPERLVMVEEFPLTASGKVRKDVLREQILAKFDMEKAG